MHTTTAIQTPVAGAYRLDAAASTISFTTRHMFGLGTVRGTFAVRDGQVDVADPVAGSAVRATVGAASVDTGIPARDQAVRSATYLDAERHPLITFASTDLRRDGERWVLHGTLTVCGVTRPVELGLDEVRVSGPRLRVLASTVVDRYEFGVTAMRGLTGRRLRMRLEITATR
jgi:polyisoprenoid-binding protein YceI